MTNASPPRLPPIPKESWSEEAREALRKGYPGAAERFLAEGDTTPVPHVLATLLHNPAITAPFLRFNRVLLETPLLGHRRRELMVLRVAWRTNAPYEWVQHTRIGRQVGISADEIRAITGRLEDGSWSPHELDLLRATDQLVDGHRIDDATWARLAEVLDEAQLVEVVFTVGTYTLLAMAFNSFGLQLDPGLEPPDDLPVPGERP